MHGNPADVWAQASWHASAARTRYTQLGSYSARSSGCSLSVFQIEYPREVGVRYAVCIVHRALRIVWWPRGRDTCSIDRWWIRFSFFLVRSDTNDAKIIWKIVWKSRRAFCFSIKNAVWVQTMQKLSEKLSETNRKTERKARFNLVCSTNSQIQPNTTTAQCARCPLCSSWSCYPIIR